MEQAAFELAVRQRAPTARQPELEARARRLAWLGIGWHAIEAVISLLAGIAAGSIALVAFGADSVIEGFAGGILIWRFTGTRAGSEAAELRAQRLIAITFFVLAAYVAIEAARTLINADHPAVSWVGIGLAAVTVVIMPLLARAKARVGYELGSSATSSEGRQNQICAYLSAALLVGLGANALLGWWWADHATALAIAAVAVSEGRDAWRGEACCEVC